MKKLFTILVLLFASVQLKASHLASEMNLRMFDNSWFTVNIDNQYFQTPVTRFRLDRMEPGTHFITVQRMSWGTIGHFAHPVTVFSGYIEIPAASRINALVDRNFRFRINKVFPIAPEPVVCAPAPVVYGMSEFEFGNLMHTISRLSFESSRMQVARQALSVNFMTASQVSRLVSMMTFESSKLDLAKFAFHKTLDKENYFIINDQFTFESSILELNDFIYRS